MAQLKQVTKVPVRNNPRQAPRTNMQRQVPGRKKMPIKTVQVQKVPSNLKGSFKDAIINKLVDVAVEEGPGLVVRVYETIEGPLGNFLKNAPNTAVQVGCDAAKLAEEAFEEVIKAGEAVARVVGHEVEYFVVHTVGDPVVHELEKFGKTITAEVDKCGNTIIKEFNEFGNTIIKEIDNFGNTITREIDNFGNTISREANNFKNTVGSAVNDVGRFFSSLFS